jgi:hypothetical protein
MLDATWDNLDRSMYRDMRDIETAYLTNLNPSPKSGTKALLGRSPVLPMTFELGAPEYALLDKIEGGFGRVSCRRPCRPKSWRKRVQKIVFRATSWQPK